MEKVKIYVETKGIGDAVIEALREVISKDALLDRLTIIQKIPATAVISISGEDVNK